MRHWGTALVVAMVLLCSLPALAQGGVVLTPGSGGGGCVNSPENPTALLALVGTAGGFFSYARARHRARRKR